jgi:hypothetical protein
MRRIAAFLALTLGASLLAGCVYNPYTGTWQPCCNYYGYPYYRYPPPYYPYGYPPGPYMAPPQVQPGAYPNQPAQPPPGPGAANYPQRGGVLAQRFAAANVTHDGRLTREQAVTMPMVARNFDSIDLDHNGYVTLPEVRVFAAQQRAERGEASEQSVQ